MNKLTKFIICVYKYFLIFNVPGNEITSEESNDVEDQPSPKEDETFNDQLIDESNDENNEEDKETDLQSNDG